MSRDYDEKRDYVRVNVETELYYTLDGGNEEHVAELKNLSGRGMMFIAPQPITIDRIVHVRIDPVTKITPSLNAEVRVVRSTKQRHGDGYEIGAVIQLTDDDEPVADTL